MSLVVNLYLVHHGSAVEPWVNPQRPLSDDGCEHVARMAAAAAARGARPSVVWHSGKLRARQTAEAFWRSCNPLAECAATSDLQPDDPPERIRDRLCGESRDILVAGHFPHLQRLLSLLSGPAVQAFPQHGVVALASDDEDGSWKERWRIESPV